MKGSSLTKGHPSDSSLHLLAENQCPKALLPLLLCALSSSIAPSGFPAPRGRKKRRPLILLIPGLFFLFPAFLIQGMYQKLHGSKSSVEKTANLPRQSHPALRGTHGTQQRGQGADTFTALCYGKNILKPLCQPGGSYSGEISLCTRPPGQLADDHVLYASYKSDVVSPSAIIPGWWGPSKGCATISSRNCAPEE